MKRTKIKRTKVVENVYHSNRFPTPVRPCDLCSNDSSSQYWHLNGYYGITGRVCSCCYDKVSHDAYGRPNNPEQYKAVLVMQQLKKATS